MLDIKTALQKFGYVVEDMAMDNDIQGEELLENSECVVLLGSSLVQIANGNKLATPPSLIIPLDNGGILYFFVKFCLIFIMFLYKFVFGKQRMCCFAWQ